MGLKAYVIRRLILAVPLMIGVMTIVFVFVHLAPGDPVITVLGMRPGIDFTPADLDRIRHAYGLDRPIYVQYFDWISDLLHGDLGYSYVYAKPVSKLIASHIKNTLLLQTVSFAISLAIAIPAGVISAVKQYSKIDYVCTFFTSFFWSMPRFWLGLMMILTFTVALGVLPSSGMGPPGQQPTLSDMLIHLILPAVTLGLNGTAFTARLTRASMLEVLRQDYILTARSKGLKERIVIYKHAFRNALLPVVTLIGVYVGWLIGGSVIVETVFAWPGIGMLVVDSANFRDYPVVMGVTLVVALSMIICVIITDIVYAYLDPRIKY